MSPCCVTVVVCLVVAGLDGALCVCCGLDFELVFGCECVGSEEMLTGRSKVLTLKETVPEIRHGSVETSTYSGKRRKHTLIYAFNEIVLLKQNNSYYFPLYFSYSITQSF